MNVIYYELKTKQITTDINGKFETGLLVDTMFTLFPLHHSGDEGYKGYNVIFNYEPMAIWIKGTALVVDPRTGVVQGVYKRRGISVSYLDKITTKKASK